MVVEEGRASQLPWASAEGTGTRGPPSLPTGEERSGVALVGSWGGLSWGQMLSRFCRRRDMFLRAWRLLKVKHFHFLRNPWQSLHQQSAFEYDHDLLQLGEMFFLLHLRGLLSDRQSNSLASQGVLRPLEDSRPKVFLLLSLPPFHFHFFLPCHQQGVSFGLLETWRHCVRLVKMKMTVLPR